MRWTAADLDSPAKLGAATLRTWRTPPHLRLINQRLRTLSSRGAGRLTVFMPPRHGKSLLISQFFPAWFLLVYPWKRVILCSYEADFAAQWGRKVRDLVAQWGPAFGVAVSADSKAADRWEIAGHGGGMQTAGVVASRFRGPDLIDDPDYYAALRLLSDVATAGAPARWLAALGIGPAPLAPGDWAWDGAGDRVTVRIGGCAGVFARGLLTELDLTLDEWYAFAAAEVVIRWRRL